MMKYFIGNWKMFGTPKSLSTLNKVNYFISRDKNKKKYKVIITPPFTLIQTFVDHFKNKKISIGAQNSYQKEKFSSDTGAISPNTAGATSKCLKSLRAKKTFDESGWSRRACASGRSLSNSPHCRRFTTVTRRLV